MHRPRNCILRCIKYEEDYSSTSAEESSEDEEDAASMRDEDVDQM